VNDVQPSAQGISAARATGRRLRAVAGMTYLSALRTLCDKGMSSISSDSYLAAADVGGKEKRYPAMTYSPAPLPGQYHRRRRA
jgi:hypothetical protein